MTQNCQKHPTTVLKQLFSSWFCPECAGVSTNGKTEIATKVDFHSLSPSSQRVMIAKDVLARIAANELTPKIGTFVKYNNLLLPSDDQKDTYCTACALGALIVCCPTIKRHDVVSILLENGSDSSRLRFHNVLKDYFSSDQLYLIEAAFETTSKWCPGHLAKAAEKAANYSEGTGYGSIRRMKMIMENIINNNGEFVIE